MLYELHDQNISSFWEIIEKSAISATQICRLPIQGTKSYRNMQPVIKIASFNIRTIKHGAKTLELIKLSSDLLIDIQALQEQRRDLSTDLLQNQLPSAWCKLPANPHSIGLEAVEFKLSLICSSNLLDKRF